MRKRMLVQSPMMFHIILSEGMEIYGTCLTKLPPRHPSILDMSGNTVHFVLKARPENYIMIIYCIVSSRR